MNDPAVKLWHQQLAELQARYKHVRPAILAALCVLQQEPGVSVDDAKARAASHGVRITAASVNAAQRLLERQDGAPSATTPAAERTPSTTKPRERRARMADKGVDPESLIRATVVKLQAQANAEAQRLRDAMRKVIGVLQAAVGS